MPTPTHQAGFISLIGLPNAGKSTLLNALVGRRLSIITPKPQTTRHNILGIVNTHHTQSIYTDTPGFLTPAYLLQKAMLKAAQQSLVGTDLILWLIDIRHTLDQPAQQKLWQKLKHLDTPIFLLLNKIDKATPHQLQTALDYWKTHTQLPTYPISALQRTNLDTLQTAIRHTLPVHPPYYPKDTLTDKSARFLAAEMIREQIFLHYRQEIPYHTAVQVQQFEEQDNLLRIAADIFVTHPRHKPILIGAQGKGLEKISTAARQALSTFFDKKIFLKLYIAAKPTWRHNSHMLKSLGHR